MASSAVLATSSWQNALKDTLADPAIKVLSGVRCRRCNALFFGAAVVGAPAAWMEPAESYNVKATFYAVPQKRIAFEANVRTNDTIFHFTRS